MRLLSMAACGVILGWAAGVSPMALAQANPPSGAPASGAPGVRNPNPKIQNPSAPAGQRVLTITVPDPGRKFARIIPSPDAKKDAELPSEFTDTKTTLAYDPAAAGKSPRVAVDDDKTGNTAIVPIPAADTPIDLHHSDFDHVRFVKALITYDNKPVLAAHVTLEASDKTKQTKTIDAAAQGAAVFEDVPAGKARLTVVYGDHLTQTQDVVITTDHPAGPFPLPVAVSTKVPTLDTPVGAAVSAPAAAPSPGVAPSAPGGLPPIQPAPPPAPAGGGIGGLIGDLLAIALVAGGGYLFWKWFQSGGFAATMKKAGIEVSGPPPPSDAGTPWQPNAPAPPVVSDPSLCPFCGQKKDAAGNCACTLAGVVAGASPASAPGGAAVVSAGGAPPIPSQPRLVATMGVYSGSIFPLQINRTGVTLGREATNTIALGNDTTVSRRHAAIRAENGTYIVSDEGSSNGVYVNGVRISGTQPLRPGDEVQIGNTRFRFEV